MSFRRFSQVAMVLTVAALMASASAFAAKPAAYSPSLSVSWPVAAASTAATTETSYLVSGCGYNAGLGGVTVVVYSPGAAAFAGAMPDSNGCVSLSNFATNGAGHYEIDAFQTVRGKSTLVASTSFDL
jgi:hypothetical protein